MKPSKELALLQRFVSKLRLLSNRWPCPFCGRKTALSKLVTITVYRSDGVQQYEGCWYCNLEPLLEEANDLVMEQK